MDETNQREADAFMRHFKLLIAVCIVVPGALFMAGAIYLDQRLATVEEGLDYREPTGQSADAADAPDSASDDRAAVVPVHPARGQTVYVPAYSHVYHEKGDAHLLTVTLSARNTDPDRDLVVTRVAYHGTDGREIRSFLKQPIRLRPLASTDFLITREDTSGGSGANFLVEWVSAEPVSEPAFEAVMIDTRGGQGIAFVRPGIVVRETIRGVTVPPTGPPADAGD
ncbi:DUF3124 domain-containing protein [Alienimonas californiensis]|uniref:DUF3124 domain-containing protein n=1 Tax=Alienimonas californiensis TaxID=2527989 RepID=A0A517PE99_9PLAN|nr:DUF3124 domain-containing protein [Alienimonas californiensis]QDT17688.1 hypothetical protein CA12_38190 [Alienimonas californiensis]